MNQSVILCAAGLMLAVAGTALAENNPLYSPPAGTQTNPLAGQNDAPAASGQIGNSAVAPANAKHKNSMSSAQSNPLYTDKGSQGTNPLHQPANARGKIGSGDAAAPDQATTDDMRERAAQDARQAARPPITPPAAPPPMVDVPMGGAMP
jgi:hypothetical protein